MPRVGARPPRPCTIGCLSPGTPFALPPADVADYQPARGVFVELAGGDAKVVVADRVTYWSSATVVLPAGAPVAVPATAKPRPAGPSRAERREQRAVVERAVARERSAPRQPAPIVQRMLGEEC